jgi:hypothetical protein
VKPFSLVEQGTLARPGPYGRLLRLVLGAACLSAVYQLLRDGSFVIQSPVTAIPNLAVLLIIEILLFHNVVNIGFGVNWGRRPTCVAVVLLLAAAAVSWLLFGTPNHPLFGAVLWIWVVYFYAHAGVSFVAAAAIATPGCEMRALPELLGKVTGRAAAEHPCPASFIKKLDEWEQRRRHHTRV